MAGKNYLQATRHPWPCLLFLVPLLVAYEGGVIWLGGAQPDALRNGADVWLRWTLDAVGLPMLVHLPPVLVALAFLVWSYARRGDRPRDLVGVVCGMVIETVFFALGLWGLSRAVWPLFDRLAVPLTWHPATLEAVGQAVTFIGAGLYEEVLFRLLLFSGLVAILRAVHVPGLLGILLAAVGSAALFAAAHHLGPFGEPFNDHVFFFRLAAGVYFAIVYQTRGFGVAAGAHALYDVVVGVAMG